MKNKITFGDIVLAILGIAMVYVLWLGGIVTFVGALGLILTGVTIISSVVGIKLATISITVAIAALLFTIIYFVRMITKERKKNG